MMSVAAPRPRLEIQDSNDSPVNRRSTPSPRSAWRCFSNGNQKITVETLTASTHNNSVIVKSEMQTLPAYFKRIKESHEVVHLDYLTREKFPKLVVDINRDIAAAKVKIKKYSEKRDCCGMTEETFNTTLVKVAQNWGYYVATISAGGGIFGLFTRSDCNAQDASSSSSSSSYSVPLISVGFAIYVLNGGMDHIRRTLTARINEAKSYEKIIKENTDLLVNVGWANDMISLFQDQSGSVDSEILLQREKFALKKIEKIPESLHEVLPPDTIREAYLVKFKTPKVDTFRMERTQAGWQRRSSADIRSGEQSTVALHRASMTRRIADEEEEIFSDDIELYSRRQKSPKVGEKKTKREEAETVPLGDVELYVRKQKSPEVTDKVEERKVKQDDDEEEQVVRFSSDIP